MTSKPGKKITGIHKLLNISVSKGNQAVKLGLLTKYNQIFLEKSYKKCGWETSPRPCSKTLNWAYL